MAESSYQDINDERKVRLEKLAHLSSTGFLCYPSRSGRTHTIEAALKEKDKTAVAVAGRIMAKREIGKLTFCRLRDESGEMQAVFRQDDLGAEQYKLFVKKTDAGDMIDVVGTRGKTKTGEESILANGWTMLAKSIRPLPDKFHGLQDEDTRLRKRYLDILFDPELKDRFHRKARFWQGIRAFLIDEGFLEVETPVLETSPGGADAEPFATHHNALDMDVNLRISMGELWQKRLMIAGFEKTFEIGRQFRNEGMSREHLQDYMQMEFYWGYANYEDGMQLVERMYKKVLQETFGRLQFDIGDFTNVDLSNSWDRIDYVQTIEDKTGLNVLKADVKDLHRTLGGLNISYEKHEGKGRLMDSLWKYCRKMIKGPVFLVNLPVEVSPLAKRKADDPRLTERYQIIIAGSELGNGYSELNDPVDQAKRFEEQTLLRKAGDREAQMHDEDFVEALEHGMPPTTGFGLSERVFSFFENKPIRECVMFPLMRPVREEKEKTLVGHAIILDMPNIPLWSKLNAAAHLTAALGARLGKKLIEIEHTVTTDGEKIPMNIRHAVMMKKTNKRGDLLQLKHTAEQEGLFVTCFTEEMRDSKNDQEVKKKQEAKSADDIAFLGVLVYGEIKKVEHLTKQFLLYE